MVDDEQRPGQPSFSLVQRMLVIAGAVLLLAGFVWLWWQGIPALYRNVVDVSPGERLKAVTDTRTALLAGLAALGALGTFWVNARTQRFTAWTLRISDANFRLAERSQVEGFELTERGHLTDRYAKAIEQLGNDKLDIRLGGIYALEQIAHDSPRGRDQDTLVEVLSAFVRLHSDPIYQYKDSLPKGSPAEPAEEQRRKADEYVAGLDRPPVDVQAAVTVLGGLPVRAANSTDKTLVRAGHTGNWDTSNIRVRADLKGAWLRGAHLREANLVTADLSGANMAGADLLHADLADTNLHSTNLRGANLSKARLTRATLGASTPGYGADLHKADLTEADLTATAVFDANLTEVVLHGANLTDAVLHGANLKRASLAGANLTRSVLINADLTGASLRGADLTRTNLSWANLAGVSVHQANLKGADLSDADLSDASDLTQDQIDAAWGSKGTRLPPGRHHPDSWPSILRA